MSRPAGGRGMAMSRGVLPRSPSKQEQPDYDPSLNALRATSAFDYRSDYRQKAKPKAMQVEAISKVKAQGGIVKSPSPSRMQRADACSPGTKPPHHLTPMLNKSMSTSGAVSAAPGQSVPRHRFGLSVDDSSSSSDDELNDENIRDFKFRVNRPRSRSCLGNKKRSGDVIATRNRRKPSYRGDFLNQMRRDLKWDQLGLTFHRRSTIHSNDDGPKGPLVAGVDSIAPRLEAVASVPESDITAETAMLVRESEELRAQEEAERVALMEEMDAKVTSLPERMSYEDYVVVRRLFWKYAGNSGESLKLSLLPRGGWAFCGKVVTHLVARKLDRDHSGSLDLSEVLRWLYPAMNVLEVQRCISRYEAKFQRLMRKETILTIHRVPVDDLDDFARTVLHGVAKEGRCAPGEPRWLYKKGFAALISAKNELVSAEDVDRVFNANSHCRPGGEPFLDLEAFVSALYVFPTQFDYSD